MPEPKMLHARPTPPRQTIVLTALLAEAKAIGPIVGADVHVIGMRATRMPAIHPGSRVILAGLGGALDPTLRVGDLVIDTPVEGLPIDLPWHVGPIHTSDAIVSTPGAKSDLFQRTQAMAVDIEQSVVRNALPTGTELIGIRAVSDDAQTALDPAVLRFVDDVGRPRPLAIASALIRRPGLIPQLNRLRADSNLALWNLGLGVRALLERFTSEPPVAYAPPFAPGRSNDGPGPSL